MAEQLAPNMKVDSHIACRKCKEHVYTLYRVAVDGRPDLYTHRLWPARGVWAEPPTHSSRLVCPKCSADLVRIDQKTDATKEKF
jgi:hypothetical protein